MNEREIRRLIKIVEESEIEELEVRRWWGYRLRISKRAGWAPAPNNHTPTVHVPSAAPAGPPPAAETVPGGTPPAAAGGEEEYSESRYHIIRSPIVGTFYRAPAPDAPPYATEGDTIKVGQVVCIVEAMKLMNEIQAEKGGRVVKVITENAQPVEYNQKLIVIDPEG